MTRSDHRLGPVPGRGRLTVLATLSALSVLAGGLASCSDELPPSGSPAPTLPTESTSAATIDLPNDPLVLIQGSLDGDDPVFTQTGSAKVVVKTSSLGDGTVGVVDGVDSVSGGPALRFPAFVRDPTANYPRAVLTVSNAGSKDAFDPGGGRMILGVDFNIDGLSAGRDDDNGNNLIQRGLSSDDSLYKLEVDANMRPACTVRGTEGTNEVRSPVTALPGEWYRVRCTRDGDEVEIEVGRVLQNGTIIPIAQSQSSPIGIVSMNDPSIPISIGGKVAHNGAVINSASDQFNGLLRNPFVAFPG